jgi:hypothetical protein
MYRFAWSITKYSIALAGKPGHSTMILNGRAFLVLLLPFHCLRHVSAKIQYVVRSRNRSYQGFYKDYVSKPRVRRLKGRRLAVAQVGLVAGMAVVSDVYSRKGMAYQHSTKMMTGCQGTTDVEGWSMRAKEARRSKVAPPWEVSARPQRTVRAHLPKRLLLARL